MKTSPLFILLTLFVVYTSGNAQAIEGYAFTDYAVEVSTPKTKAAINFNTSHTARHYKTKTTKGYNTKDIDFGGYYITILWGCGTNCLGGVMVDTRNGNAYELPITAENASVACYTDYDVNQDMVLYKPNSRLFITTRCIEKTIDGTPNNEQVKDYFVNEWNEQRKKFIFLKKITQTTVVKRKD